MKPSLASDSTESRVTVLGSTTGALYAVSADGEFEAVETGTQWDTRILMDGGDALYSLEHDGSLYAIQIQKT